MTEFLKATGIKLLNYLNKPISVFQYFVSATIIISLFVFSGFWKNLINTLWVTPIMSHLGGYEILIAILYSLILIRYYFYFYNKEWNISKKRLTIWSIYTFIYLYCYLSGEWNYTLMFENCKFSAWTHLSLLPFIVEFLFFIFLRHKNKDESPLLEIEKIASIVDSYKRNSVSSITFNVLKTCFVKDCNFSVAITGMWGSGKTTFLNGLKDQYLESKINIIIFEPWKSDSPDLIINSFFTLLRNELKGYIPNISSLIDEYILTLLDGEAIKPLKLLSRSLKLASAINDKNIYEQIKEELSRYQHKIVVFIDDIDRLNAEEIKEVLRLVRNTANFPYLQFITAYDKDYLIKALKKDDIDNPERYLEKFFNVEITLPKFEERIICNELHSRVSQLISDSWKIDVADTRIKEMIYARTDERVNIITNDYLIPRVLPTMRDVIRYTNAFKLTITSYEKQQIINEIEFQDLFFLELLRYRFYDIYEILRNQPLSILEIDNNYIYTLKKDDKLSVIENILEQYETRDRETINDVITCILNSSREHSLCKLRDYNKYFMLRLDDKILLESEILALMGLEETELFEKATILHKSKYPQEFENQIYEILKRIPTNTNIIENEQNKQKEYSQIYALLIAMAKTSYRPLKEEIITAIIPHVQNLYCYDVEHFRALLKLFEAIDFNSIASRQFDINNFLMSILIKDNLAVKLHKIITIDDNTVISTFLENTKHPEVISQGLTSFIEMLESNSISNDKLVLNKSELSDIQLNYFANYKYKLSLKGFTLFYNCWKEKNPVTQQVRLRDEALNIMKKEIEKTPEEYFKMFIRPSVSSHPEFNTVSPEPYCKAFFGSNENFETFLDSCNSNSSSEERVKNYWMLYKYNGYSPIEFENQGNVNEKIENCFKDEIKQLKELLFIKEQILKNNEVGSDLIKLFENNSLYIKLREDVRNMINNVNRR